MPKQYYHSFIKDNSIVIAGHVLVYLKSIIIMPIIIKSVGVTVYGGFALLTSILGIAFGLAPLGAGFRAQRFLPSAKTMEERRDLFYPQFFFNVFNIFLLSFLFVLLQNPLKKWLFKDEVSFSIWIIPLYLVLYILFSQSNKYFRYTSRVQYMMLADICFPYLHIGFIVLYLIIFGSISINMLVISMAFSALLVAIPMFWVIFKEINIKFAFYDAASLSADIRLGFPLVLAFIVDFILAAGDRYFIASYLTVKDVGHYVPGYVLGSLIVFIPKAMGTALPQLMSQAVDGGKEQEAHNMLDYAIKIYLLLAIPFVFGCLALSRPMLTLLANPEVAGRASSVTPIVALGALFYGMFIILSNILFVRQKTFSMFKMNMFAAIFNLAANFILFYIFRNILVAAITTLISYFIAFFYMVFFIKKDWPVRFQSKVIIKSIVASLLMLIWLFWISTKMGHPTSWILVMLIVFSGIAIYAGGLAVLRTLSKKEIQFIRKYIDGIF